MLQEELSGGMSVIIGSKRGKEQFESDTVLTNVLNKTESKWITDIETNPSLENVQNIIQQIKSLGADTVVGFGGGSALDTAKAVCLGLYERYHSVSLKKMISIASHPREKQTHKLIAIPTTSGTGSEVTPFATIWDKELKRKHSLNGPALWPDVAIVDPELADTLPSDQTIYTGLDAINQAAESVWNKNANPITLSYASKALKLGLCTLPKIIDQQLRKKDREKMALCSLMAGMAISNTRTALCHSISYPLTAHFGVPHGLACAFTMPAVARFNNELIKVRFGSLEQCFDFETLPQLLDELNNKLNVRFLIRDYIPSKEQLVDHVNEMINTPRANNNIRNVEKDTIYNILITSW